VSREVAAYRGALRDHVRALVKDEVTRAVKDAPPVVYFDNNGRTREVPDDNETIVRRFIDMKLSGSKFLDGPWETTIVRSSSFYQPCASDP
jgi:hypothetical protein